jgi:pyruvate,water dikinase
MCRLGAAVGIRIAGGFLDLVGGDDRMSVVMLASSVDFIRWFDEIGLDDLPLVGGKNASLGEMFRELSPHGIRVPPGFAITAHAYRYFLQTTDLDVRIRDLLSGLDTQDVAMLQQRGRQIRQAILGTELPADLQAAIVQAYDRLSGSSGEPADVAVRSSATAEDLPDASFAGQQETYLNVQGHAALLETCKRCFASLFTDRAISYRVDKGFDHFQVALSVGVQRMVRADLACSGVMFSIDTETGFRDVVLINAAYGLGENVVQGAVNPDEYVVFKPTLKQGYRPIVQKKLGGKEFKLVYDVGGSRMTRNVPVPAAERERFALTDDEVLQLARWACQVEEHYSAKRGQFTPMDMEWAKDGRDGQLYLLQARPETVQSQRQGQVLEVYRLQGQAPVLLEGRSVGATIASGPVRVIHALSELPSIQPGEVLVADKTDPDWEPAMKKAAAIVTNRGGRTCHAAIVSRELGVPAVVGTERATAILRTGQVVTVSCAEGQTGKVYDGRVPFSVEKVDLAGLARPRTRLMLNLANPEEALRLAQLPNDGVGLVRIEFIITHTIQAHPLALLYPERLDPLEKQKIEQLTRGYADKAQFFVEHLARGVGLIAAAFYPRDVIVRFSDFKTNEYAHLIGGAAFEPSEENPMLGFRGAARYYHPRYREGFALECQALKKVRDEFGLTNVKVMVPFCRTVEEGRQVLQELARNGLVRGENGLEVYVMCEIPSNVILAGQFAEVFDGFSIGSNDLTQLTLGVDRDSEIVAPLFDERHPAVQWMLARTIHEARAHGRKVGICGQAPSDYPELARFLVEQGIDSLSLNPDALLRTMLDIVQYERELAERAVEKEPRPAGWIARP